MRLNGLVGAEDFFFRVSDHPTKQTEPIPDFVPRSWEWGMVLGCSWLEIDDDTRAVGTEQIDRRTRAQT